MLRFHRLVPLALALTTPEGRALAFQWLEPECQTLLQVNATTSGDSFAWLVLPLGDIDGDGRGDLVASAPLSGAGASAGGKVTAHSGADGTVLWTRTEPLTSAVLGYAMEVLDWNGDGVLDVLAAAPFNGVSGGHVRVFSGVDGATLSTYNPSDVPGDNFGTSLAIGGDFDGDGTDDVAIGATHVDVPSGANAGRVYVYSGTSSTLIATIDAPVFVAGDEEFSIGLTFLGDVSLPPDGRDDLVVTYRHASFWDGGAIAWSWNGASAGMLWSIDGLAMDYNLLGDRCDGGSDFDGDGRGDFVVGSTQANIVRIYAGHDGSLIRALDGNGEGGSFGSGHMVPDADGDGRADLLLGASSSDMGGADAGKAFLYSGRTGVVIRTMTGTTTGWRLGREARAIGDHDGDGVQDYVIGGTGGGSLGPPPGRFALVRGISPFTSFCASLPNSTGSAAEIFASGSSSVAAHDLALHVAHVPSSAGLFFHGASTVQAPFGNGYRCVTGGVRRGSIQTASGGAATYTYDASDYEHDLTPFVGMERHFQYCFRDLAGGGFGFNTSDGVSVRIWP